MCAEVAWVLVFLGTQVQPQIILEPGYLPDYLFISYDYAWTKQRSFRCRNDTVYLKVTLPKSILQT